MDGAEGEEVLLLVEWGFRNGIHVKCGGRHGAFGVAVASTLATDVRVLARAGGIWARAGIPAVAGIADTCVWAPVCASRASAVAPRWPGGVWDHRAVNPHELEV